MSKKLFTEKERKILSTNQYVKKISPKGITYTDEFKRIFITENKNGKFPREIFERYGFDVNILGIERVKCCGNRWRAPYRKNGICGLKDSRKENSGKHNEKNLSIQEKFERLKAQNNLLKAENELLKKIDMMERGLKIK